MDAPEVRSKMHERYFLREKMFGPYSFINVPGGKEDSDGDDYSLRNIVEAAVVVKIVQKLYKGTSRLPSLNNFIYKQVFC